MSWLLYSELPEPLHLFDIDANSSAAIVSWSSAVHLIKPLSSRESLGEYYLCILKLSESNISCLQWHSKFSREARGQKYQVDGPRRNSKCFRFSSKLFEAKVGTEVETVVHQLANGARQVCKSSDLQLRGGKALNSP